MDTVDLTKPHECDAEECYSCGVGDVSLKWYPCGNRTREYEYEKLAGVASFQRDTYPRDLANAFCALCAGTLTGNSVDYPSHYPEANVLKTICAVGNAILKEIRKAAREAK